MAQKGNLNRIHWLWLLVPAVVAAEVFLQWSIPCADPSKEEWVKAAQAVIDQKQDGDLVVIAPSWATQGRIYLKPVIALRDFGRFETSTYDRIIEVSLNEERAPETEGLALESEQDIGRISVCRYRTGGSAKILFDFKRAYFLELLRRNDWNVAKAAREAGVSRTGLHKIMKELGIEKQKSTDGDDDDSSS